MSLSPGDRLGPFEITAWLGAGGMGEVYKARDTRLNRTVAIKLLHDAPLRNPELQRRFEREAEAVANLTHPHIGVLYDVGEHDGERFLVMEYLEGETLASRLARGPLPLPLVLIHAREIAEALDFAHRHGVLHRDLKPANVMLTKSGAKLLDFGISKLRARGDELSDSSLSAVTSVTTTVPGTILGTAPYMSPERIEGKPSDARADIFAFGAVLYEMLTGRRAFEGQTDAAVLAAVLKDEPRAVAGIPSSLDRLLRRCLARDPEDRWQSARDLAEALSWVSPEVTATPAPISAPHAVPRWGGAAAVIAIAGAVVWGVYYERGPTRVPQEARPVIVLMDSTLPDRVYDPATRSAGGTNSDDITDALRDLPVELHKETTSALWHREEQVLRQRPGLVMMHLSSFAQPTTEPGSPLQPGAVERAREFLGFVGLASPRTRFIVYTRGFETDAERQGWVADTEARFPVLKGRVEMLHVPGHDNATFRNPDTRELVRAKVKQLLEVP